MDIIEKFTGIRVDCPECGESQYCLTWMSRTRLNWNFKPVPWSCHKCGTHMSFTAKGLLLVLPCLLLSILLIRLLMLGLTSLYPEIQLAAGRGKLLSLLLVLSIFPLTLFISGIFRKTIFRVRK